jgi:large subunit ribosomal protein L6
MSRIGKQPIELPKGAKVKIEGTSFIAEGPRGKVVETLFPECPVEIADGVITVTRLSESATARARHGLSRSLLSNAVQGVTEGFKKELEVVGVGYKGEVKGRALELALGYSHPVVYSLPEGIDVEIDKANKITISGANRQQVGQVAAELRALRPPDPYKAKGIRYSGEVIRRKVGKAGAR